MLSSNYTLEIISDHPEFRNRALRKYNIEGINTVGAFGSEPFSILFRNNTYNKVEIIISLDGTDILTGKPADTNINNQRWLVNPYSELKVSAWCESNHGGARFIFTNANNSVALNTHGDMSNRGIIAAAVFVEGHVEPVKISHHHHHHPSWFTFTSDCLRSIHTNSFTKCADSVSVNNCSAPASLDLCDDSDNSYSECNVNASQELRSLASVGAGEYVNQHISYVQGLIKPIFTDTVRVRYLWWDELKAKLEQGACSDAQPSGFPGDKHEGFIKLGKTPRVAPKCVEMDLPGTPTAPRPGTVETDANCMSFSAPSCATTARRRLLSTGSAATLDGLPRITAPMVSSLSSRLPKCKPRRKFRRRSRTTVVLVNSERKTERG
jgi:hypothetical protein